MVMRVGGLASGMDIESMVNKLMDAERIPLVKLEQDKMMLEWKRDAFREVNRSMSELDSIILDMKLSKTYDSKSIYSSQPGAVIATGSSKSTNGSYNIKVDQLATNEMHVGDEREDKVMDTEFKDKTTIKFATYDDSGELIDRKVEMENGETYKDALKRINDEDNGVRAFYDSKSKQVVLESTQTGEFKPKEENLNSTGYEKQIVFNDDFFGEIGLTNTGEAPNYEDKFGGIVKAENAKFTYNDSLEITTQNNSCELNGINFQFNDVTNGNAKLTVTNDVDASFDKITAFVDKYNEVVEKLNKTQSEKSISRL